MAKFVCKCETILSNSTAPNEIQLRVYSRSEWEDILQIDRLEPWMIPLPHNDVWKCPQCQRIYLFEKGQNGTYDDKPKYIFRLECLDKNEKWQDNDNDLTEDC